MNLLITQTAKRFNHSMREKLKAVKSKSNHRPNFDILKTALSILIPGHDGCDVDITGRTICYLCFCGMIDFPCGIVFPAVPYVEFPSLH